MEVIHKAIHGGVENQILIRGKNGELTIRTLKKGKKLYVFKVIGKNAGSFLKTANRELDKLAKKLGCNLITADVSSDRRQKLPRIALKAGFEISPRSYFQITHGNNSMFTKRKLAGPHISMHKRIK